MHKHFFFKENKGYKCSFLHVEVQVISKIVSEYDQEIPQSQTTDNPVAPRGRAAQPSRDTRKINLSKPVSPTWKTPNL